MFVSKRKLLSPKSLSLGAVLALMASPAGDSLCLQHVPLSGLWFPSHVYGRWFRHAGKRHGSV
jgi:hypothetical protein